MNANSWLIICFGAAFLAGLGCSLTGKAPPAQGPNNTECLRDLPPLISLDATVEASQSQQLEAQLKHFARLQGYAYELAVYSADGQDFSVHMDSPGVLVVAGSPFTRGEFFISFYNQNCDQPTTAADLRDEERDLIRLLKEIPGIEIVQAK